MPVAARFKACVCDRFLAGNVGSNSAGGMDVCLLWVLCVVRYRPLRRADLSSRGVLPSVLCLIGCNHESSIMRRPWPTGGGLLLHGKINIKISILLIYTVMTLRYDNRSRRWWPWHWRREEQWQWPCCPLLTTLFFPWVRKLTLRLLMSYIYIWSAYSWCF